MIGVNDVQTWFEISLENVQCKVCEGYHTDVLQIRKTMVGINHDSNEFWWTMAVQSFWNHSLTMSSIQDTWKVVGEVVAAVAGKPALVIQCIGMWKPIQCWVFGLWVQNDSCPRPVECRPGRYKGCIYVHLIPNNMTIYYLIWYSTSILGSWNSHWT